MSSRTITNLPTPKIPPWTSIETFTEYFDILYKQTRCYLTKVKSLAMRQTTKLTRTYPRNLTSKYLPIWLHITYALNSHDQIFAPPHTSVELWNFVIHGDYYFGMKHAWGTPYIGRTDFTGTLIFNAKSIEMYIFHYLWNKV